MGISGRPVDRADVETERNGKRYAGKYSADGEMVTVYFAGTSKKARLGNSSPELLAQVLLGELVDDSSKG